VWYNNPVLLQPDWNQIEIMVQISEDTELHFKIEQEWQNIKYLVLNILDLKIE